MSKQHPVSPSVDLFVIRYLGDGRALSGRNSNRDFVALLFVGIPKLQCCSCVFPMIIGHVCVWLCQWGFILPQPETEWVVLWLDNNTTRKTVVQSIVVEHLVRGADHFKRGGMRRQSPTPPEISTSVRVDTKTTFASFLTQVHCNSVRGRTGGKTLIFPPYPASKAP